jgi:four helix bundle protein
MLRNDKENVILNLTFQFSLDIIDFVELLRDKKKYELAQQIFKSGTSIGANIREAQNAESKSDFIHKFKIAAKEADETEYWLELCEQSKHYPKSGELLDKVKTINKIISKIISSSKREK